MAVTAIIEAYGTRYDQIRSATAIALERAWRRHGGPTEANATGWLAAAVPVVEGAQIAVVQLVDAYLAAFIEDTVRTPIDPIGLDQAALTGGAVRGGIDMVEVYRRPIVQVRTALSRGATPDDARAQGLAKATSSGETDVALSHRAASSAGMQAHGIVGYQRVLDGKACTLCALASTQRYRSENLLPIHNRCGCRVAPIIGDRDPGQVINRERLRAIKATGAADELSLQQGAKRAEQRAKENRDQAAKESDPAQRRRLEKRAEEQTKLAAKRRSQLSEHRTTTGGAVREFEVNEHGELGPVLTVKGQSFAGPSDIE